MVPIPKSTYYNYIDQSSLLCVSSPSYSRLRLPARAADDYASRRRRSSVSSSINTSEILALHQSHRRRSDSDKDGPSRNISSGSFLELSKV
mmetsp:Transcript_23463/g.44568  ORF Transcript_23463/g.44568 Transcript_23463/m.44568 type:complete len:91 (+) Transcript_23463:2-274(+)